MVLLIAASMTAILSRFSVPDILAGSTMVLTATVLPRHKPAIHVSTQQTAACQVSPHLCHKAHVSQSAKQQVLRDQRLDSDSAAPPRACMQEWTQPVAMSNAFFLSISHSTRQSFLRRLDNENNYSRPCASQATMRMDDAKTTLDWE